MFTHLHDDKYHDPFALPHVPCKYCEGEPEPGWIEMDNNGPIVRCPVCNPRAPESRP